jgi:hypothetical protein
LSKDEIARLVLVVEAQRAAMARDITPAGEEDESESEPR